MRRVAIGFSVTPSMKIPRFRQHPHVARVAADRGGERRTALLCRVGLAQPLVNQVVPTAERHDQPRRQPRRQPGRRDQQHHAAVAQCRETMKNGSDKPLSDRIREMTQAFTKLGVTAEMLSARLGRSLDSATPDDLVDLRGIYQGIRDGASSVRDWFAPKEPPQGSRLDQLEQQTTPAPPPKIDNATPEQLAGLADDGWPGPKTEPAKKGSKP